MKLLPFLVVVSFALASRPARALFCQSASVLDGQVELCDDNEKFAAAAEACVVSRSGDLRMSRARGFS